MVMNTHEIVLIPGHGIGPEVTAAVTRILAAAYESATLPTLPHPVFLGQVASLDPGIGLDGLLDEVAIWDRALSSQEIAIVLAPDYIDSPVVSRMYNRLAEDLVDFTSQIPLVVLNSLDGTRFSYGSLKNAPFRR